MPSLTETETETEAETETVADTDTDRHSASDRQRKKLGQGPNGTQTRIGHGVCVASEESHFGLKLSSRRDARENKR